MSPQWPVRARVLYAALVSCCLLLGCMSSPRTVDGVHALSRGWLVIDSARSAPPELSDLRWLGITLPDSWRGTRPAEGGIGWYRFSVHLPDAPHGRWAVYLPYLNMTADAYVNGHAVGSGGSTRPPLARNFNRPLLFEFPGALLRAGENRIDVALAVAPHNYGSLAPLYLGPEQSLARHHQRGQLLRTTLPWLETFLCAAMALFMAALWRSTRDGVFASFALASALYAVASCNYWVVQPPLEIWAWERLTQLCLFAFGCSLALWARSFIGQQAAGWRRALLSLGAVASLLILATPAESFFPTIRWFNALTLLMTLHAAGSIVWHLRRVSPGECLLYVLGGSLSVGFGVHDFLQGLGYLDGSAPYLLPHDIPIMVLTFGTSLARRFTRSLRAAEQLNRTLEQRVAEKHAELEAHYHELRALEHERLLTRERERMIREMHDGLGSQLTSALALLERGRSDPQHLRQALRLALDEMRLVIHSLDSEPRELGEVLGVLRPRLQPILDSQQVQLGWRVDDIAAPRRFGAEESLHLQRIVQEAIANCLKHARPTRIEVAASLARPGLALLSISDDGCGFDPAQRSKGRGLSHMQARARALRGTLEIVSAGAGARVSLSVPVDG